MDGWMDGWQSRAEVWADVDTQTRISLPEPNIDQ